RTCAAEEQTLLDRISVLDKSEALITHANVEWMLNSVIQPRSPAPQSLLSPAPQYHPPCPPPASHARAVCLIALTFVVFQLTANVRPQTVCMVQWDWRHYWQPRDPTRSGARFLDVVKGERVWVLRLSPDSGWVEVRKLDDWDDRTSVGWVPITNLISPQEVVENLILLDNVSSLATMAASY
ncbi:hypothetical protein GNI_150400, partial [Gregarina niphandrodes]